jgi:hypothetical protein
MRDPPALKEARSTTLCFLGPSSNQTSGYLGCVTRRMGGRLIQADAPLNQQQHGSTRRSHAAQ